MPLTKVVVSANPFQRTSEEVTKLAPLTVIVKASAPEVAVKGEMDVIVGFGLLITKPVPSVAPPPGPGFTTVILAVPAFLMSFARIVAVN